MDSDEQNNTPSDGPAGERSQEQPQQPTDGGSQPASAATPGAGVSAHVNAPVDQQQIASQIHNHYTGLVIDASQLSALFQGNAQGVPWASEFSAIRRELQDLRQLFPSLSESAAGSAGQQAGQLNGTENMPTNDQELYAWFGRLTAIERCHVRATAILHAAPTATVTQARDELYAALFPRVRHDARSSEHGIPASLEFGHTIMEHTFTVARWAGGAERMYWKDADSEGQSAFGIQALNLLAGEIAGTSGIYSENARAVIDRWVTSGRREFCQRAAYAQGVIWQKRDHGRLNATIRSWAISDVSSVRQCAALMAWGAFVAECVASGTGPATAAKNGAVQHVPGPPPAPGESSAGETPIRPGVETFATLRLLRQMAKEAQTDPVPRDDSKMLKHALFAYAVSAAYGLIAIEWTDYALDGLDQLAGLDPAHDHDTPRVIPAYVVLPAAATYALVAADGHVREALSRLSAHAGRLARKSSHDMHNQSAKAAEKLRADRLFNALLAFYLTAWASRPTSRRQWGRYGERNLLEDAPKFDGESIRDVLLDGLLSAGETMLRTHTQSLLWASMTDTDTARLADEALLLWAEQVAQAAIDAPHGKAAPAYERFLVSLDALIARRDKLSGYSGSGAPRAHYRRLLERWSKMTTPDQKKQRISSIARAVLAELPPL